MKMKLLKYIGIIALVIIMILIFLSIMKPSEKKQVFSNVTYDDILGEEETDESDWMETNIIGFLEIPKIGLSTCIEEGIDMEVIDQNVGHFPNSSVWDGNIALASHNRGENTANYFEKINQLEKGDLIIYYSEMGERRYNVSEIREISSTDWSVTENTKENIITLLTCVANQPDLRLCVQGTEVK